MYKTNLQRIISPLIIVAAVLLGMFINSLLIRDNSTEKQELFLPIQGSKLDLVLNMVNYSYVDSIDIKAIEEDAIQSIIKDLDPHTVYLSSKDMVKVSEDMTGNFGGIGIQFYKYRDTVIVINVIPGGPSEKAGVEAGDRIIKVNDSLIAGAKMPDNEIISLMRGEINTPVNITIRRQGEKQLLSKNMRRGSIPIKSVDISYMVNDTTGYIKINNFALHTYEEFMAGLQLLQTKGMKKLIVDLRDNEGGILPIALKMINEFLEGNKLMLYTQGKASPRSDYFSNGKGKYKELPLTILINESSASASEIFAGAIQDNDRGTIIGRRSFGKGLVQEQRVLPDGSALRLTVARYYIPSGRSIQRPYHEGTEKYYTDFYERILHGELEVKDSIHFDENQKFQTVGGRTVYGGGGIMPDVFVPADTTGYSDYLMKLNRSMQLYNFTFDFMDRHRKEMKNLKNYKEILQYLRRYNIVGEMVRYAAKNGVKRDPKGLKESYSVIKTQLEAYIGRHILDNEGFYPIIGTIDTTLQAAISDSEQ